uniref:Putative secreted protein n=1 Tax=Rhipicephalus microplus TaxID=6941 RepID=A0A6M2DA53_RHIMP
MCEWAVGGLASFLSPSSFPVCVVLLAGSFSSEAMHQLAQQRVLLKLLRSRFGIWLVETMDRCRVRTFTGYCFPEFKLQAVGPYRDKGARLYT